MFPELSLEEEANYPTDDDLWAEAWLERNYGGAPDECSHCFREGKLIKIIECEEH
jgi:hypothetical protein